MQLLDLGWRLAVDSIPLGVWGQEVMTRDRVVRMLASDWDDPPIYDHVLHGEKWGMDREAEVRAAAAVAAAGGPAPMREPGDVPDEVRRARERAAQRYPELLDR